jgi:hypothetical protein
MILVRSCFQLEFGKARDAIAAWKEGVAIAKKAGLFADTRLLTDFAGPSFYTLILETTYESLADYEAMERKLLGSDEWKAWYQRVLPLLKSGHREILKIVE